jgi:ABC-type transport system substrate-binding protein
VPRVRIEQVEGLRTFFLGLNPGFKPFDNKLVRQAISDAIDRAHITSTVYPGYATPACLPWPSSSWAAPKDLAKSCTFDLAKAKSLLAQAGFSNGFSTTVNVSVDSYAPGSEAAAVILQQDLAKIGISLKIQKYEQAAARSKILSNDYDMLIHSYGDANSDPSFNFPGLTFGPAPKSFSGFDSPEYEAAVQAGAHGTTQEARATAYRKIAQIVLDEAFIDPISFRSRVYVTASDVKGFAADEAGYPIFTGVSK